MSDALDPTIEAGDASRVPAPLKAVLARIAPLWRHGSLSITAPDGRLLHIAGSEPGPAVSIELRNLRALRRLVWNGDVGFAEGYMAGDWDTPDLRALLRAAAVNLDRVALLRGSGLARLVGRLNHWRHRNSETGAKRNIHAHYDLGNRFYAKWLDATMTYSSALFETPAASLAAAQTRKYAALASRIGLSTGHQVLEIGCGWGGFAEFAAREIGARVTALTISKAQFEHTVARMQREGLSERVRVLLKDYRAVTGWFDRVVSIEMIEAVGERYWPAYFAKIASVLRPGGLAGIQAITIEEARFASYRARPDFIQRYVFPGGMLASEARLTDVAAQAGLGAKGLFRFGEHYARTLEDWACRFNAAWSEIAPLGFDERFRRLWNYYLAYCEAGFLTKQIDVVQLALQKA